MNASPLGCFRLVSLQNGLNLKFEGLTFSRFVGAADMKIVTTKMVREVLNNSQKHQLDVAQLAEQISIEEKKGHDCWQISCGHDIVGILSVAFRKVFGGKSTGDVARDVLERSLRLAYDAAYLRETELYQGLVAWEHRNPGCPILTQA